MSNSRQIVPLIAKDDDIIYLIRNVFGFTEYPYEDMDSDMILLAFTPKCQFNLESSSRLKDKYGTCDHQILELYGDRILYGVIANILYELFGLTMTPHFYTTLNSILTKNRFLTDIMIDKQACELVRSQQYVIKEGLKFHNQCADSFEALIGAIFIHLKTKRVDYMTQIKNWLLKNTGLPYVLKQYLNENGFSEKIVYVVNDRETLRRNWIKGYELLKSELVNQRSSINNETYQYLINAYSTLQNVTIDDFSFTGIIINDNTFLSKIFEYLQWPYSGPILTDNGYIIEGIPNGISTVIGTGESADEAIDSAGNYLLLRGYIVPMKTISLEYSTVQSGSSIPVRPRSPTIPKIPIVPIRSQSYTVPQTQSMIPEMPQRYVIPQRSITTRPSNISSFQQDTYDSPRNRTRQTPNKRLRRSYQPETGTNQRY